MLIKEFDPLDTPAHPLKHGDSLYFLRNRNECALRVKATIVRFCSLPIILMKTCLKP